MGELLTASAWVLTVLGFALYLTQPGLRPSVASVTLVLTGLAIGVARPYVAPSIQEPSKGKSALYAACALVFAGVLWHRRRERRRGGEA